MKKVLLLVLCFKSASLFANFSFHYHCETRDPLLPINKMDIAIKRENLVSKKLNVEITKIDEEGESSLYKESVSLNKEGRFFFLDIKSMDENEGGVLLKLPDHFLVGDVPKYFDTQRVEQTLGFTWDASADVEIKNLPFVFRLYCRSNESNRSYRKMSDL